MGVDCKSTGSAYAGSNPARPKIKIDGGFEQKKFHLYKTQENNKKLMKVIRVGINKISESF